MALIINRIDVLDKVYKSTTYSRKDIQSVYTAIQKLAIKAYREEKVMLFNNFLKFYPHGMKKNMTHYVNLQENVEESGLEKRIRNQPVVLKRKPNYNKSG